MQRPEHLSPSAPLPGHAAEALRLEALEAGGWTVLQDCPIGGPPGPPPRIPLVLLHPEIGVALLETGPEVTPEAESLLRHRLEVARFQGIFSGHLPILHRTVAPADLPGLERILAEGFAALKPLTVPGGDAWVSVVRRALSPRDPGRSAGPLGPMPTPSAWAAPAPPEEAEPPATPRRALLNKVALTRPAPAPSPEEEHRPMGEAAEDAAPPPWWRRPWPWVAFGLGALALAGAGALLDRQTAPSPPRPAPDLAAPGRAPAPPGAVASAPTTAPAPAPAPAPTLAPPAPASRETPRPAPSPPAAAVPPAPRVEPPPTASPQPTAVTRSRVNLRTGPSDRATVLRVLPRGQGYRILDRAPGGWVQVGEPEPIGWVHSSLLDETR